MKALTLEEVREAGLDAISENWQLTYLPDGTASLRARKPFRLWEPARWTGVMVPIDRHGWHHLPACACRFCREGE
jgi:hypothetical protein